MTVEQQTTTRPLVVAHRGASAEEAEHTLRAYRRAYEHGADGVECDVRLTADHHLVCVHDRRVERTSNGAGVVSTLELARLEQLDWASWKNGPGDAEGPDADPERGHLLTLRRLLDSLVEQGGEPLTLIETKHPTRHGDDVEKTLVQVLRAFDLDRGDQPGRPHVRVMSFSGRALQRVHKLSPKVPLVHLVSAKGRSLPLDGTLPPGVRTVGLDIAFLRKKASVVQKYRRHGHGVFVWTVDREEDMDLCRELGVDVVITNRPRVAIDRIRGTE
ncbi:glycerophosphodiester phosphodiesterase family protein [Phycicoccus sp.]|mgnify:CR=1 FL=1|uniref:glycerophosphodiester phosphodiesterase n=1 Tax=Phycicoccus sp. TaxID=1902410 RepID=UPI002C386A1D|nr:glycerophosphodiester phosphodiesterase family protein [Phycicoccus sp.]HMM94272.1 glycerophosphodiester phosphodiesterase family protein [Phycicoccus sp.]